MFGMGILCHQKLGTVLDSSRGLQRAGKEAGGVGGHVLEVQVKRSGLFNDTTCER